MDTTARAFAADYLASCLPLLEPSHVQLDAEGALVTARDLEAGTLVAAFPPDGFRRGSEYWGPPLAGLALDWNSAPLCAHYDRVVADPSTKHPPVMSAHRAAGACDENPYAGIAFTPDATPALAQATISYLALAAARTNAEILALTGGPTVLRARRALAAGERVRLARPPRLLMRSVGDASADASADAVVALLARMIGDPLLAAEIVG